MYCQMKAKLHLRFWPELQYPVVVICRGENGTSDGMVVGTHVGTVVGRVLGAVEGKDVGNVVGIVVG